MGRNPLGPLTGLRVLRSKIFNRPDPVFLSYAITHRCNQSCAYCAVPESKAEEMDLDPIRKIFTQFAALKLQRVSLTGGEPLVHEKFEQIVKLIRSFDIGVSCNTNGLLIEQNIDALINVDTVTISLDGPPEIHDSIRGKGSFERVQKGITLLKDRGVSVKTQVVLSTHNLDRIDDLVETVRRLNAPMMVQPVWSRLLGSTRKNPGLPSNQLMQTGVLRLIELKKQNAPIVNSMAALRHFLSWPDDRDIGCIAGISMFKMLPDGRLTGCVRTPEKPHWVDLKTMDVSSAIRSQPKVGCRQCWCAGQVEAQMAGRFNPEAIFGLLGRYF